MKKFFSGLVSFVLLFQTLQSVVIVPQVFADSGDLSGEYVLEVEDGTTNTSSNSTTNYASFLGVSNDLFDIYLNKGSSSNPPAFNTNADPKGVRLYFNSNGDGGNMTIAVADGYQINSMEVVFLTNAANNNVGKLKVDANVFDTKNATKTTTDSTNSIEMATNSVKISNNTTGTNIQVVISKIIISVSKIHKVTFESNGGTEIDSKTINIGDPVTKPIDPTKAGHVFVAWYKDSELTSERNFDDPIEEDMTLYAKWIVDCEPESILFNVSFDSGKDSLPTGWTADGLAKNYKGDNVPRLKLDTSGDRIKSPSFYLIKKAKATVRSKANSANGVFGGKLIFKDQNGDSFYEFSDYKADQETNIEFEVPSDVTQITIEYEKTIGNIGVGSFKLEYTEDWGSEPKPYTVYFNSDEDTVLYSIPASPCEKITKPEDPQRDGYSFVGRYVDGSEDFFDFNTAISGDLTLIANWHLETYNIVYDLDDGVNSDSNPDTYTIETEDIILENPNKEGFDFLGWYDSSETKIDNISKGFFGDITLTAKWQKKKSSGSSGYYVPQKNNNEQNSDNNNNLGEENDFVHGSPYDNELDSAYFFASKYGLTTKTISEARLEDTLTRAEFAKIISTYAVKILKTELKLAEKNQCVFSDLDRSQELGMFSELSCRLNLMGMSMGNEFNPNNKITRAEVVTVISRLYGWAQDNLSGNYFNNHMKEMHERGYIKNTDPTMDEIRGYVFIMLQRVADGEK
ncbi:MAG: InlB B-repeat-containing protein [Candidatus Absconditabacterales bacterium]|nr:InlB B-repeat-containing protein [Candidatus Absconditabacterales bacterium]